jgi:COPII coat assembly protein SEC16
VSTFLTDALLLCRLVDVAQEYTTGEHQNSPSNPYDPYTPRANTIPTQSSAPHTPQTHHQQPTSMSTSTYAPSQLPSSSQAAYKSYTPSVFGHQTTSDTSMSYPYAAIGQTSYSAVTKITPSVPPPPAPSAEAYRPKKSNAYDPPLPPPKSSRRAVSAAHPTRTVSPAVGQQTYPLYDSSTLPPPPPLPAQYASYLSPPNVQSYGTHAPAGFGGREDSAHSYQSVNSWNSHNSYTAGDSGNHATTNGVHDLAQSTNMSSQYVPHPGVYTPLSSPPKAPGGGKIDETPTPRQLPSGMVSNNANSLMQPARPMQQPFSNLPYGQTQDWANVNATSRGSPPNVGGDEFATTFSSMNPQSQESRQYPFSGNAITNGQNRTSSRGSSIAEMAGSPAQTTSQLWSTSPRVNPDLPRARDSNAASPPPPSNYAEYASNSYDQKVVGRTPSPSDAFTYHRNGTEGAIDAFASTNYGAYPFDSSEPNDAAGVQRVPSPAYIPNGTRSYGTGASESYVPATAAKSENVYDSGTHDPWQEPASHAVPLDPYAPNFNAQPAHVSDPKLTGTTSPPNSWQESQNHSSDPYAPPLMGSTSHMPPSATTNRRYPPPLQSTQQPYGASQFSNSSSAYSHFGSQELSCEGLPYDSSVGQDVLLAPPTHLPYAPSPSLMGLNDPLGRASARIPVFSFGFGGKVVTCFHGISTLSTGFDVALSSRQSSDVHIRVLHKVIPESAMDSSAVVFPGPLFSDPGTPTNSLVRTTASQVKAKKARVSKYLDERADEIHRGIAYMNPNSEDRKRADGKLVLVKLLKVMLENDGQLSGT